MLISLDWIKDFAQLSDDITPLELGLRLTMGTAEVEGIEEVNGFWKEIKVVEVTHIEPHPEADKLNLVSFKLSDEESFRVVCGAANVRLGMKTPFAPIGTTLPVGFTLEPKKIRGILSEGMLCSEEELGLAEKSSGIMELPDDAPLGVSLDVLWDKKRDVLFDIDNKSLTHRPDLWGHFGMAREFAALYEVDFKNNFQAEWSKHIEAQFNDEKAPMGVKVQERSSCLGYYGISLDGVKVEESPDWIKDRLLAVGLRPINNIVDISNYVMIELGIPLHIFDRDLIKGDVVEIDEASKEMTFTTLDEEERKLVSSDTIIKDSEKALVLAGIMGGLECGVNEKTKNIFIEVANWEASRVRKTSTRLGLRTDSSMRYEKTLDSQLLYRTLLRTIELVQKLCPEAKVIGRPQYDGPSLDNFEPLNLELSVETINKTLGKEISTKVIMDILQRLDFKVTAAHETLKVEVPSYRSTKDIECSADIIEEVGRVIGYDNIEPVNPLLNVEPVRLSPLHQMKRDALDFLTLHSRAFEVTTYPMVGPALLKKCQWEESPLKLLNSLSVDQNQMRDSLIPSFLEVAAKNSKNFENFRFFEWGRTYHSNEKTYNTEKQILGLAYFDKEESPILPLLNDVQRLGQFLNIPMDFADKHPKFKNELIDESWVGVHPFEFKNIRVMGKMKGVVFSVHPLMLKNFKVKGNLSIALIDMSPFEKNAPKSKVSYKPLAKFPSSRFDYTLVVKGDQNLEQIFQALKKVKLPVSSEHKVVTTYAPEKGETFVTMAAVLSDVEKTLPGEVIKKCEELIISGLEKAGFHLKKA